MLETLGPLMGTCELCGMEKVSTKRTRASSTIVDCCTRCIDSLGLTSITKITDKFEENSNKNNIINNQWLVGSEKEELIPNFHIKIREERETQNLSQEDLAKKINERVNVIQKIENGNRVTDSVIKKLAKALDIILYGGISPQNERTVKVKEDNQMTMADANISDVTNPNKTKLPKKKMRKLGVTRSGARKKIRE